MIDKDKAEEIKNQIEISLKEIRKLLGMTFEIKQFNEGFGSHYPIECERQLQIMKVIF